MDTRSTIRRRADGTGVCCQRLCLHRNSGLGMAGLDASGSLLAVEKVSIRIVPWYRHFPAIAGDFR